MIDKITSLADLYFKCKTNELYQKLAVIFVNYEIVRDEVKVNDFRKALEVIEDYRKSAYLGGVTSNDCNWLVGSINLYRPDVIERDVIESCRGDGLFVAKN